MGVVSVTLLLLPIHAYAVHELAIKLVIEKVRKEKKLTKKISSSVHSLTPFLCRCGPTTVLVVVIVSRRSIPVVGYKII